MSDSTNPLYQKGYRAGRRRTEREVAETTRKIAYAEGWNRVYTALLPVAMTCSGWSMNGQPVHSTESRVRLAKAWADEAVKNLK